MSHQPLEKGKDTCLLCDSVIQASCVGWQSEITLFVKGMGDNRCWNLFHFVTQDLNTSQCAPTKLSKHPCLCATHACLKTKQGARCCTWVKAIADTE